jgi:hypothetical protein
LYFNGAGNGSYGTNLAYFSVDSKNATTPITAISGTKSGLIRDDSTFINQMMALSGTSGALAYLGIAASPAAWAAWAYLKSTSNTAWCVDSLGNARLESPAPATAVPPGPVIVCP